MSELVRLRVRGAPLPREQSDPRSARTPRRAVLLHVSADESERLERAVAVELLDNQPVEVLVGLRCAPSEQQRSWALRRSLEIIGASITGPTISEVGTIGRRIAQRCGKNGAGLVGFDLGWTFGRIAGDVRRARSGVGMSVGLLGTGWSHRHTRRWLDSHYSGYRLRIEDRGDSGGAFVTWIPPQRRKGRQRHGPFVDLAVLGPALGADAREPASLAKSYGIAWPDRSDALDQLLDEALVLATCYRLMLAELGEVAPGLAPQECWSAGSIVTHAFGSACVRDPAKSTATLPRYAIGSAASAFHGGRVEALQVGCLQPMALVDLKATYPRVFELLGLSAHLTAECFEAAPIATSEAVALFADPGLRERLDDRRFWRLLGSLFVEIEPHGEDLPCHREAGERFRAVTAPLDLSGGTLFFSGCDLVRPGLASRDLMIRSAFHVEPRGVDGDLRPFRAPSGQAIDVRQAEWGAALINERRLASEIADHLVRVRREVLAKEFGVSGAWGVFARVDRHRLLRPVSSALLDPSGAERALKTSRPDVAGPLTLWHLAAAIPAACRALLAICEFDLGLSAAAAMTDALAVPIGEGGVSRERLRTVLARFDPLLCPEGGAAWNEEGDSLSTDTLGLILGLNKVLLGRRDAEGHLRLVRSSDTGLGDHFLDPAGSGERLEDGRTVWAAELEARLFEEVAESDFDESIRLPSDLPDWTHRPALRPRRASTLGVLRRLRDAVGDQNIGPFAHYTTTIEEGPVCLGTERDPAAWTSWPWRNNGQPARIAVQSAHGDLVVSEGAGPIFVVPTVRAVFRDWLSENDATVEGPKRGLRHVRPVFSHPALIELVGRSGEPAGENTDGDPTCYGSLDTAKLVAQIRLLGAAEITRRSGLAGRTAREAIAQSTKSKPATIAKLAAAASAGISERHCEAGPLCRNAGSGSARLLNPRQRRWCCDACQKVVARRKRGIEGRERRATGDRRPRSGRMRVTESSRATSTRFVAKNFADEPTCSTCGAIFLGVAPEHCPDCDAPLANSVDAL